MTAGYCERKDVRRALQKASFDGAIGSDGAIADAAITGLTQWLRRRTRRHWYDSGGGTTLVPAGPRTVSEIRLDVPSGPHRQQGQLLHDSRHIEYPVTHSGSYCKVRLPHYDVETLHTLAVRDRDGTVTDWVSDSRYSSGRGEDYYLHTEGDEFTRSYVYVNARSIGGRTDFANLLTVGYDYGTDQQDDDWSTVRRSVAMLAAADLVMDEDVKTAVPDDGQLVSVQTKAERYVQRALDRGLSAYFDPQVV